METSNKIRSLNRIPFDFVDGLLVKGIGIDDLVDTATEAASSAAASAASAAQSAYLAGINATAEAAAAAADAVYDQLEDIKVQTEVARDGAVISANSASDYSNSAQGSAFTASQQAQQAENSAVAASALAAAAAGSASTASGYSETALQAAITATNEAQSAEQSAAVATTKAQEAVLAASDPGVVAVGADLLGADTIGTVAAVSQEVVKLAGLEEEIVSLASGVVPTRVVTIANGNSISINADLTDVAVQSNSQVDGTLTINAPTGTPGDSQRLIIRLKTDNIQNLAWNGVFQGSSVMPLPSVSSGFGFIDYFGFFYDSTTSKWQLVSFVGGF